MSTFGNNIKKIRKTKNLSQAAFAELFNLKRATLGAYEENRSLPKLDTVINIANYFGITIDSLLTKEITVNELSKFGDAHLDDSFTPPEKNEIAWLLDSDLKNYPKYNNYKGFLQSLNKESLPNHWDDRIQLGWEASANINNISIGSIVFFQPIKLTEAKEEHTLILSENGFSPFSNETTIEQNQSFWEVINILKPTQYNAYQNSIEKSMEERILWLETKMQEVLGRG
jgi:transcriptional regulator with XRE-family HTH domain